MPTSASYTSSLGGRIDQAKWEFGLPDGARRLVASGDFDGRNNEALVAWLDSDPALGSRLLRWCNSPMYNLATPFSSLREAAQVMEGSELARLAVLAFARGLFPEGQLIGGVYRDRLWGHSIAVGAVASMISRTSGRADPSMAFVAGALHDIGQCANQRLAPETYQRVMSEVDDLSPVHEVEQEWFGWDHAQLGAAILQQWGLPGAIQSAAAEHHRASGVIDHADAETVCCVSIANFLCSRAGWSSSGYHNLAPPANAVLDRMGMKTGMLAVIWQQVGESISASTHLH